VINAGPDQLQHGQVTFLLFFFRTKVVKFKEVALRLLTNNLKFPFRRLFFKFTIVLELKVLKVGTPFPFQPGLLLDS
jgi:hypothetical protein